MFGRAAQAVLLWRLEKGERIGILDMLAGSTSFTSTIASQLRLRMISILGVVLVAVWTLSPIGGQASFRQMAIETDFTVQQANYTYLSPQGELRYYGKGESVSIANTVFLAALIGPGILKSSPLDSWCNVKIPRIEPFEEKATFESPDGWFDTKEPDEDDWDRYSSIMGIPIAGVNSLDFVNYSMNIETMYMNTQCSFVSWNRSTPDGNGGASQRPKIDLIPNNAFRVDGGVQAYIWWSEDTSKRRATDITDLHPFNFSYAPAASSWGDGFLSCTVTSTYVEAAVDCPTAHDCATVRLRRSRLDQPPPGYTQLDSHKSEKDSWNVTLTSFLNSNRGEVTWDGATRITLMDKYISFPENPSTLELPLRNVSEEVYSIRLGQLLTAYWASMNGYNVIAGGIDNGKFHLFQPKGEHHLVSGHVEEHSGGARRRKDVAHSRYEEYNEVRYQSPHRLGRGLVSCFNCSYHRQLSASDCSPLPHARPRPYDEHLEPSYEKQSLHALTS